LQLLEEPPRLRALVDHDLVRVAPPHLERDPRAGHLVDPVQRAAKDERPPVRARRAADLDPGEGLQHRSAGATRELVVAQREVGDGVEGDRSREEARMLTEQEERLLSTHASADREDALRVDAQPWTGVPDDSRHPREIVDLTPPAPGVERQTPSHSSRTDHRKVSSRRQVAPEPRVRDPAHAAAVGRDDERQRRRGVGRAEARRRDDDCEARHPVVGAVAKSPVPNPVAHVKEFQGICVTASSQLPGRERRGCAQR
jgi:hypothetical protein